MGLDQVLVDFLMHAAAGAGSVLLIILFLGISIPQRTPVTIRRTIR